VYLTLIEKYLLKFGESYGLLYELHNSKRRFIINLYVFIHHKTLNTYYVTRILTCIIS
jgi:hypothetical protein